MAEKIGSGSKGTLWWVADRAPTEGLVDLVRSDALVVVEEGAAVDDVRAPDLGVGEELDRVLDVVVPQRPRPRRGLEGQLRLCLADTIGR